MQLIDGKKLAASIRERVKQDILTLDLHPKLAVLLVGNDPASHLYVSLKEKAAKEVGVITDIRRMPSHTPDEDLQAIITHWNEDPSVHAILIQLPLPPGHDTDTLIATMDPTKDVDGFHPDNAAALLQGSGTLFPPVHESILRLIGATDIQPKTARATIIANSDIFANPLERLLRTAGCRVTSQSPDDLDIESIKTADIIVIAVGRPAFLTRDLIKSGACVIDVGTNRLPDGQIVGDVDALNITDIPGWLSPVPGGVGPMTVALLLKNTVELAKRR